MAQNYRQPGHTIDVTAGALSGRSSGDYVELSNQFGGVLVNDPDGNRGTLALDGVYELPKATGTALNVGTRVYWNNGPRQVFTTASGNPQVGYVVRSAANSASTVEVLLHPD